MPEAIAALTAVLPYNDLAALEAWFAEHPNDTAAVSIESIRMKYSTAREYLDRIRVKYVEVGRPAPTKVDLLRRAVEDGILPGLDPDGGDAD